jgi:hypothetical protein
MPITLLMFASREIRFSCAGADSSVVMSYTESRVGTVVKGF